MKTKLPKSERRGVGPYAGVEEKHRIRRDPRVDDSGNQVGWNNGRGREMGNAVFENNPGPIPRRGAR